MINQNDFILLLFSKFLVFSQKFKIIGPKAEKKLTSQVSNTNFKS